MNNEGQTEVVAAAGGPTAVEAAAPQERARLLIIDDDTIHRMVLCAIAEKLNFVSTAVSTFDEAVALLKQNRFDCITLDLSLDQRHGAELLPFIAKSGGNPMLVIISGAIEATRDETVRVAKMLNLNVVQLQKPVNMSMLRETLSLRGGFSDPKHTSNQA